MSPARRAARWLLLPAPRIYVAVLFLLLIAAGTLVAFSISDVATTDAHNEKTSIESRVSTVKQRCALTALIEEMPNQTAQLEAQFSASLHKCVAQLKSVEALDASTR